MRVGVLGAAGRMGSTVRRAITESDDLELVAAVDPISGGDPSITADRQALVECKAEVAVDFTVPGAAVQNAEWCAENGIHLVIGTTGIDEADLKRLQAAFPTGGRLGCVVAPNFAIGAVLMMRFAELAAPWFDTAEIIELHHDGKVDAPSGTAMLTAARLAAASQEWGADPTTTESLRGARGALSDGGIRIHSVRLRGLVAHQEVLLGAAGQTLTLRHDSLERESFMPGVLLAVRQVARRPGLTVGLDNLLGI